VSSTTATNSDDSSATSRREQHRTGMMSSLHEFLRLLNSLEAHIDARIEEIESCVETQRRNHRVLTQCLDDEHRLAHSESQQQSPPQQAVAPELNAENNSSKLDEILSMAKTFRVVSSGPVATVQESCRSSRSFTTVSNGLRGSKTDHKESHANDTPSRGRRLQPVATTASTKTVPLKTVATAGDAHRSTAVLTAVASADPPPSTGAGRAAVRQQLQLLGRQRILSRLKPAFELPPPLFQAQASLQQQLAESSEEAAAVLATVAPGSLLLEALAASQWAVHRSGLRLRSAATIAPSSPQLSPSLQSLVEALSQELASLADVLDRSLVPKIASLPASHFSAAQGLEFVQLWYRSRLLLELLAAVQLQLHGGNDDVVIGDKSSHGRGSTWKNIVSSLSSPATLPPPSAADDLCTRNSSSSSASLLPSTAAAATTKWSSERLNVVRSRQLALQNQVSFWVEKYIAKNVFPSLIKSLKVCARSSGREEWVRSLKSYQAMFALLVSHGREHASCVFVEDRRQPPAVTFSVTATSAAVREEL
jgi:hypothetical protein